MNSHQRTKSPSSHHFTKLAYYRLSCLLQPYKILGILLHWNRLRLVITWNPVSERNPQLQHHLHRPGLDW